MPKQPNGTPGKKPPEPSAIAKALNIGRASVYLSCVRNVSIAAGTIPAATCYQVSELQHSCDIGLSATFLPPECLIGPASCLPRATPDGMEPHADFGLLGHFGERGP
jgi:hypothetical protein